MFNGDYLPGNILALSNSSFPEMSGGIISGKGMQMT